MPLPYGILSRYVSDTPQGKRPRDKADAARMGRGKLRYALDIHCPYISKRNPKDINDRLFFTAPQSEKANRNLEKFMASLEIPYTNISGKWKATPENAKHIGEKIVDATAFNRPQCRAAGGRASTARSARVSKRAGCF